MGSSTNRRIANSGCGILKWLSLTARSPNRMISRSRVRLFLVMVIPLACTLLSCPVSRRLVTGSSGPVSPLVALEEQATSLPSICQPTAADKAKLKNLPGLSGLFFACAPANPGCFFSEQIGARDLDATLNAPNFFCRVAVPRQPDDLRVGLGWPIVFRR